MIRSVEPKSISRPSSSGSSFALRYVSIASSTPGPEHLRQVLVGTWTGGM